MKTYKVLYAEDVPHYAFGEVEARNDKAALRKARKMDTSEFTSYDPDWDHSVCKRIVLIEDEDYNEIAHDIPLDDFHLRRGGDADRRLCEAAADSLAALKALIEQAKTLRDAIEDVTYHFDDELDALTKAARTGELVIDKLEGASHE